jgi:uncharacterized protein YicC (UPF0701 family)
VSAARVKWSTQVSAEALEKLKEVARREGRQLQALVDEAVNDVIEKHRTDKPRPHFMAAYRANAARFAPLLKKLAE